MTFDNSIRFRDLERREVHAHDRLVNTISRLKLVEAKRPLSRAESADKALAEAIIEQLGKSQKNNSKPDEVCDPLFVATRTLLNEQGIIAPQLRNQLEGRLEFDIGEGSPRPPVPLVALVLGILIADGADPPPVIVVPQAKGQNKTGVKAPAGSAGNGKTIYPDESHKKAKSFTGEFFRALGEARSYGQLADRVLAILANEGDPDGIFRPIGASVDAEEFARVLRGLAARKVPDDEPQLRRRVNEVLDRVQNVGEESSVADLAIDLPDLEDIYDQNIVRANVEAFGPMIVTAMFEELKVFQAVDHMVGQFQRGVLPVGPGTAGKLLYQYWRDAPNRLSEQERKNFAALTLGVPGGDPGGMVNREFNDLWLRFVSSVSSFVRQNEVDALLRSATPSPISHQQVRKAARDLAGNLSLHGYGMVHYAARELQAQIGFVIKLLQDPEILGSYGARDMWQVVDQIATYELGGARTSSRYRTLATCGTIITAWLAKNVERINRATGPIIDMDRVRNPDLAGDHKATRDPSDYDLVNACELWLADTATSDSQVEEMAQPREAPQMTSKPIPIPALAREMLGDMDIGLGLGLGRGQEKAFSTNGSRAHH